MVTKSGRNVIIYVTISFAENLSLLTNTSGPFHFQIEYLGKIVDLFEFKSLITPSFPPERVSFLVPSDVNISGLSMYLLSGGIRIGQINVPDSMIASDDLRDKVMPVKGMDGNRVIGSDGAVPTVGISVLLRNVNEPVERISVTIERLDKHLKKVDSMAIEPLWNNSGAPGEVFIVNKLPTEKTNVSINENRAPTMGKDLVQIPVESKRNDEAEARKTEQSSSEQPLLKNSHMIFEQNNGVPMTSTDLSLQSSVQPPPKPKTSVKFRKPKLDKIPDNTSSEIPAIPKPRMVDKGIRTPDIANGAVYDSHDAESRNNWRKYGFTIDLHSIKNVTIAPTTTFFRYKYEPFGPSPTITSPTVVRDTKEALLLNSLYSFEIAMSPSKLKNYINSVPIKLQQFVVDADKNHVEVGQGSLSLAEVYTVSETNTGDGSFRSRELYIPIINANNQTIAKLRVVLTMHEYGAINVGSLTALKENEITEQEYLTALDLEMWKHQKKNEYERSWQDKIDEISKRLQNEYQQKHDLLQKQVDEKLQEYQSSLGELENALQDVTNREKVLEDRERNLKQDEANLERKLQEQKERLRNEERQRSERNQTEKSIYNERLEYYQRENKLLAADKEKSEKRIKTLQEQVRTLSLKEAENERLAAQLQEVQAHNETLVRSRHEMKKKYTKATNLLSAIKLQKDAITKENFTLKSKLDTEQQNKENEDLQVLWQDIQKYKTKTLNMGTVEDEEITRLKREKQSLLKLGYHESDEILVAIDQDIRRKAAAIQ